MQFDRQRQPKATGMAITHAEEQPTKNEEDDKTQSPAVLWAVLIETEAQFVRAERQVRAISKTSVADTFLEVKVRAWTKETLWKMCKFITNDKTMHKVMRKASKHFKVPDLEQEHWMSSYAHIVRDGLNQKRNACSQDLRKTIKSKCQGVTMDYLMNCLTMCL
jgi:transposase-like protein